MPSLDIWRTQCLGRSEYSFYFTRHHLVPTNRKCLSRIDSNGAWMRQSKPQLPMYKSQFRDAEPLLSVMGNDLLGSPFENSRFETFLWKDMFSVACDLHRLTYMLELHRREEARIRDKEREYFEDTYAAVQYQLVSLPHPDAVIAKSTRYYRQNCWRLAAFIYFNIAIRTCPVSSLLKSITNRLIESLQESEMSSAWVPFSDVLLWVVFMGCCATGSEVERGWFALEWKRLVRVLGLKSFEETESLMSGFLYRSNILRKPLCELWATLSVPGLYQ